MKVDNELQQLLLQNELLSKQATNATTLPQGHAEFADVLSRVTKSDEAGTQALNKDMFTDTEGYRDISVTNLATINAVLAGQLEGNMDEDDVASFEDEILNMTAMLDGLDSYAEKLSQSGSEKSAWQELQKINAQMAGMNKKDLPPELSSIMSEIEVLTSTEEFKMNRGDYQA